MAKSSLSKRLRDLDKDKRSRSSSLPPLPGREDDDEVRVSWVNFVFLSAMAFIVLLAAGVFFGMGSVEGSLEAAANRALFAAGFEDIEAEATGNAVLLNGTVTPTQSVDEAAAIVAALPGVGSVEALVWLVNPTTNEQIEVVGDPIVFTWSGANLTVKGHVSTEEMHSFLVGSAEAAFTSVNAEEFSVKAGVADERDWMAEVVLLVGELSANVVKGEVIVNPSANVLVASAEFDTRQQRRPVAETMEEGVALLGFDYVDGLRVKDAPPPPPKQQVVELQQNLDELIEGKVVEFETKSAVITDVGKALLDELFAALQQFPDVAVEIAGHTDSQGTEAFNQDLSEARAQAAFTYLVGRGADADRFIVIGYGEGSPIADNNTNEGRARNRRIEFIALEE